MYRQREVIGLRRSKTKSFCRPQLGDFFRYGDWNPRFGYSLEQTNGVAFLGATPYLIPRQFQKANNRPVFVFLTEVRTLSKTDSKRRANDAE